jgi:hypothetical protein
MKTIGTTSMVIKLMNIFPTGVKKYLSTDRNKSGANIFKIIPVIAPKTSAMIILTDKFIDISLFLVTNLPNNRNSLRMIEKLLSSLSKFVII